MASGCGGGSGRPVSSSPPPLLPTFVMRDTKGPRECRECRAALRQQTNSAAGPDPLNPLLRFLRFYEAKVIYTARFTAPFLPPSSPCLPPRAGPPNEYRYHDEGLYSSNSTFPLGPRSSRDAPLYSRDYRPSTRALRETTLVKCRVRFLLTLTPRE